MFRRRNAGARTALGWQMYRSNLNSRDKGGAIVLVVAIHAALLFAFLHLSGKIDLADPQSALKMFDINAPEPPPPPPPPPPQAQREKPREKEGGSAPKNIKTEPTPVVAPKPKIETPPVNPIAATETPRQGTAPTQGASDVRGPGTGAGGAGTGTGSGSGGSGSGGGGDGGVADPPHLISPVLRGRDFPRELISRWPGRATVFMRLRVDARGYVSECTVDRGTGVAAIDTQLCNIVHDRLRFRPAVNRRGQAVAGWFGYAQPAPR
jgi:protein TonB